TLKYLLKESVRGVIPDDLIERKKQGFSVPVYEWFFDRLGDQARLELDEFCDQTDFLDRSAVHDLFERGRGPQVWYLLNFALWWKAYIDK
ncbi:MAG: asparagine synthetase B, partial [Chloroflexi bacterium]|nr:asparagine synthetase B [Chloroflexota bacterium]